MYVYEMCLYVFVLMLAHGATINPSITNYIQMAWHTPEYTPKKQAPPLSPCVCV
jgi:hypothetical protein